MAAVTVSKRTGRFRLPLSKGRRVGQQAFRPTGNTLSDPEQDVRTVIEQAFATLPTLDPAIDPTNQDLAGYNRRTLAHFSQYADRLEALLAEQYRRSGQLAGQEIAAIVSRDFARIGKAETPRPSELIADWSFDPTNSRAQEWAKAEAGTLITNMTRDQQATFRQVIDQSYSLGRTPSSSTRPLIEALNQVSPSTPSAQMVRDLFQVNMNGLTVRYEQAVVNRAARQASDLADRGITGTKAVERIQRDTQKYADRLRRTRSNTIARTEILRANNEGRLAAFNQAADQGVLSRQYARKSWTVSPMDVCEICVPLDGQLQPLDQPFTNGTMTPPAHPNCRCSFDIEPNVELYQPPRVLGSGEPEDPFRLGTIGDFTATGRAHASRPLMSGKPKGRPGEIIATPADYDAATPITQRAASLEPAITEQMIERAVTFNGELSGLEYRLKEIDSLAGKIAGDRLERGISAVKASTGIKDSVRYTVILEPKEYGRRAQEFIDDLRSSGKQVTVKNSWRRGADYNGINAQVYDPDLDIWYEVQFHTEQSFDIKQGIHEIYEESRRATDPIIKRRLQMEMIEISGTQRFPIGASIVKRR